MDEFLIAQSTISITEGRKWLTDYFELLKETVAWPDGLPPIPPPRLYKPENKYELSFHQIYVEVMRDYDYELNNDDQTLVLNLLINAKHVVRSPISLDISNLKMIFFYFLKSFVNLLFRGSYTHTPHVLRFGRYPSPLHIS